MDTLTLFKSLADETRLKILILVTQHKELCVCELVESLGEIQPKISRHLALLKKQGLIQDRRQGQWVFYRLDDALPAWSREILETTLAHNQSLLTPLNQSLSGMSDRPLRCD